MKPLLPLILALCAANTAAAQRHRPTIDRPTTQERILKEMEEQTRLLRRLESDAQWDEWRQQQAERERARQDREDADMRRFEAEMERRLAEKAAKDTEARRQIADALAKLQPDWDKRRTDQRLLEKSLGDCERELATHKDIRPALVEWVLHAQDECVKKDPVFLLYAKRIAGIVKAIPEDEVAKAKLRRTP